MKRQPTFILPIFIRWLKVNHLYSLFTKNMIKYPNSLYTQEKWWQYVNGKYKQETLANQHRRLVINAPFDWTSKTIPCNNGVDLIEKNSELSTLTWGVVHREWCKLVYILQAKGLYNEKYFN